MPKTACDREPACSVAANNYQLGLVRGIEAAAGEPVHVISTWTVAMFPRSRSILQRRRTCDVGTRQPAHFAGFLNLPVLKQVTTLVTLFSSVARWLWRERKEPERVVLAYGLFSPFSLAVLGATAVFGGRAVAVVTELPFDVDRGGGFGRGRFLSRLDFRVQMWALRRFRAIIPLTQQIADDYAPGLPALVVEGGIEHPETAPAGGTNGREPPSTERVVLYSGALDSINGISFLLEAFATVPDDTICLDIYGRGPLEELVRATAAGDPRIRHRGFQPNDVVRRRQTESCCLILPRPTTQTIARYSFPSKVLEYLSSGRPVITTDLPGLPAEYREHVFVLTDETPPGLGRLIREVCSRPPAELAELGERARRFVLEQKNWERQGSRVYRFICDSL